MNLLTAEALSKSYQEKKLLDTVSFGIQEGEKIGVIGVNGCGKSTLLRMLAGADTPDGGKITKMSGMRIGYLAQTPEIVPGRTVLAQVFCADHPLLKLVREYEEALLRQEEEADANRLLHLSAEMDRQHAWELESEAKAVLTQLGITEYEKDISLLSGGQQKRVFMASALITPVDLLILDEPTNHIDNETVDWLERYLKKYTKALFMVTHDRYFLDRVVNKTFELEQGQLYIYQANYSQYLEMKAEREALLASSEQKRQNFLRNELQWIRRGAKARSTKQKARIARFEAVKDVTAPKEAEAVEISVGATRLGRKTISLSEVSKAYGGVQYISQFGYTILRDDRIGIVGPNGCGKSTLLNIISGRLAPDSGSVEIGDTVKIGVFAQDNEEMDLEIRVIDYIKEVAEFVPTADGRISASKMLEKFLFSDAMQFSPIGKLSGGEKRRLYLLKILMDAPNILLLDEPTNDLDIETLSILEEYLDGFPGAVAAVSHDRYFLDRTVDRIFAFEENGRIVQYEGGYSDYQEKRPERAAEEKQKAKEPMREEERRTRQKKDRLSYQEQRELDTISDIIEEMERRLSSLEGALTEGGSDYTKLSEILVEKEALSGELDEKMERWVYLNERAEEIEKQKGQGNL